MSDIADENRAPDLWDLVLLLWREKLVVSAIVSVFAVAGVVYSLLATQGIEKVLTAELNEPAAELDMRDALDLFVRKIRVVSEDKKAGTVTLSIAWKDPQIAADWANAYVNRLNARLREQALAESERNVKFLQQEVANTTVVSMQQSLGRILEAEMQKYMLAKGEVEYAYKIVDRASAPRLRESPKRTLIVLLSVLIGGIAATLFVVFRSGLFSASRSVKSSV